MSEILSAGTADLAIKISYFVAAALFIIGLKQMSSPVTARGGIVWAGVGMVVATLITFLYPGMQNYGLMTTAIFIGGMLAWITGRRVAMTDMPQMIALYNGMGGGAAAAIAAVELLNDTEHAPTFMVLAVLGGLIGSISFSGSLIAFGKLQGLIKRSFRFRGQNFVNSGILAIGIFLGGVLVLGATGDPSTVLQFFLVALILGVTMTLPIGGRLGRACARSGRPASKSERERCVKRPARPKLGRVRLIAPGWKRKSGHERCVTPNVCLSSGLELAM